MMYKASTFSKMKNIISKYPE
ncbi:hypothetical protein BN1007_80037 [Klebsiella variicola]|nr:hypothetical protein BN1200_350143 [Klebsiella variicola]CTQ19106.1 hypothetical protein BN1007_80037 [Klebsiella variicola]